MLIIGYDRDIMMNYYIINKEPSTYWKDYFNDSIEFRKYYKIWNSCFVREYLYQQYNGVCQFCGKALREKFTVHHTSYNRECEYPFDGDERVSNERFTFCEECYKNYPDKYNRCMLLLKPVCSSCNMIIDKIAPRFVLPTDESIPESQRGYYFMKDEIIRLNQFLKWAALSNKSEFPKTEKLQEIYKVFSEYNYGAGIYRIMSRSKKPINPRPIDIFIDNEDMKLLYELTTWGVKKLELKDEAFVNFYKRLTMINRTSEYYCFTSFENPMDEQGKLRRE